MTTSVHIYRLCITKCNLHFVKMKINNFLAMITAIGFITGCAAASKEVVKDPRAALQKAKRYAQEGEYYRARKTVRAVLQQNPEDAEAKQLMAEVINEEVAKYKELFETRAPEEFTNDEKSGEIQALLERAHSFLDMGEYDEALTAAEKIFSYDPENTEASALIDKIRSKALEEGKAEMLVQNKIARDESEGRVGGYLVEARKALQAGRPGAARLALDKILLLDPENEEALKMRRQLNEHATYGTKRA